MEKKNMKLCLTMVMAFILAGASFVFGDEPVLLPENCATPFDVSEVIEHVTHHPIMAGNTIVIKDRVYEAFFNEHGIVLKARETEQDAEDLIISVTGRPEIKDGKVVYQTEYGEITFVGTSQGIRFEQTNQLPNTNSSITNYAGNVARLKNEKITERSREGEFLIDTTVVYSSIPGWQCSPSIAYDGINYLVVWRDFRSGSADIYGTRVDQAGTILDPNGIAISTAAGWQEDPSVAFDGTDYLVVWRDRRSGNDIYGARVTQSGVVLDPSGIAISTAANTQWYPAVAFDGANFLVVWEDDRNGNYDIYGARVNQSGNVIDTLGIEISIADSYQIAPAVSFCDSTFLVVWYDGRNTSHDIYGARVTPSGTVLDPSGIAISTAFNDQQFPSVTSDGNYHFVVWHDYRNGYPNIDIYGTRVSNDGVVIDPSGIAIATATNEQMYPEIVFNDTNYLVVWSDERIDLQYYIYGARVTQSGTVLDPTGIAISNHGVYPKVASDGVNYLVGWDCDTDIYGARVSQSGTVLDPGGIVISIGTNYQWQPSVAFDANNYLVVWEDERSGYFRDIYGLRIDQYGNCLDSSAIAISTATDMQRYVSVTFGGTNYLVVWEDERNYPDIDIYGARVTQSGTVLDPMGIHIATVLIDENRPHPSVDFDGTNYLVVWEEATIYPYLDIYGVFVNQSGNVLGPSFCISNATDYQWYPSVAFDGTNYLVVWQDNRSGVTDIYGARVDQSGNILDPSGIAISTATSNQRRPSVTYDGTNYLVVWEDYRSGGCDIYGARVDQSGNVIDPAGIAISTAQDNQKCPITSWDGTDYVIVWHDFRSYTEWDVYGAKVNTSGVIIDSFSVSLQLGDQISPALAHGSGEQILVTYSGWTDTVNGTSYNAMRIWGKFYPFTGIEENTLRSAPYAICLKVYPNPVTKQCNIKYILLQNMNVHITMFDATGRLVKEIINARQNAGKYQKTIDMSDLAQSVYFIRLETDKHSQTEKVIYLK